MPAIAECVRNRFDQGRANIARVAPCIERGKPPHPIDASFLGAEAVIQLEAIGAHLHPAQHWFGCCARGVTRRVQDDLIAPKRRFFNEHGDEQGCVPCEITAPTLTSRMPISIMPGRPSARSLPHSGSRKLGPAKFILESSRYAQTQSVFQAIDVAEAFKAFHHDLAVLRIVQRKANLSMAAGQRRPVVQRPLRLSAS